MILDSTGLKGLKAELAHLDEVSGALGFIRWQWDYYRATYDLKYEDTKNNEAYFLRVNTRVESGKLENPEAILVVEEAYMGRATFPHGLDYDGQIPDEYLKAAKQKLAELKQQLV